MTEIQPPSFVWNPMATRKIMTEFGETFVSAHEHTLKNDEGRYFLAGSAGLWNMSFGFSCDPVEEAIRKQLNQLPYSSLFLQSHQPAEEFARKLVEISDFRFSSCFYTTGGAAGVETAVKIARGFQDLSGKSERKEILVLSNSSWHGTLLGSMNLTTEFIDQNRYGEGDPLVREFNHACASNENELTQRLTEFLECHHKTIAAVLIEPVQASGGVYKLSGEFCSTINNLTNKFGILTIADEVACGCGRTGTFFASDFVGLRPDIVVLSKGLTAGYLPLGAVLCREFVREAFERADLPFLHGETQAGNPMACAAGIAALKLLYSENFMGEIQMKASILSSELELLQDAKGVIAIRSVGLMACVEIVDDCGVKIDPLSIIKLVKKIREFGVIVHPMTTAGGIGIFPPLTIREGEINQICRAIRKALV